MVLKRTKVVCTIGPSTDKEGVLEKMLQAGMNVARFNFSHGSHEEQAKRIAMVRAASEKTGIPVALLLDTKGPEMRLGTFETGKIELKAGQRFVLTARDIVGNDQEVSVSYKGLPKEVFPGNQILLSDGLVKLLVTSIEGEDIITEVLNNGPMSDRKRVAVPGIALNLPPVSEQDKADILFGISQEMDYIAASFMQRGSDVVAIRKILEENNSPIKIISKIESEEGVRNLEDILAMSDGLMVARGDLGVEVPAEEVPMIQKKMIRRCNELGKPVITATQMLESMMDNPRPTRAETSDVANAILDGTDAVMLSGETAGGKYPVQAVETMSRVALYTESQIVNAEKGNGLHANCAVTTEAISSATVNIASCLNAAAIISSTESGRTARTISKYRPSCPIIAVTPNEHVIRRCLLYWGVYPVKGCATTNSDEMVKQAVMATLDAGYIEHGNLVVITAGVPVRVEGTTNLIRVHVVGDAMLKGQGIGQLSATGRVCVASSIEKLEAEFQDGDILVVRDMEPEYAPFAKRAGGLVSEEGGFTCTTAIMGLTLGIPTLVGAVKAAEICKDGEIVTVDGSRNLVYKGCIDAK